MKDNVTPLIVMPRVNELLNKMAPALEAHQAMPIIVIGQKQNGELIPVTPDNMTQAQQLQIYSMLLHLGLTGIVQAEAGKPNIIKPV